MDVSFGTMLRELRRAAGLTQRQLAERLGVDFSYISKLENDRLPPPAADTIVSIARELGVPPEQLLARTGKIPSDVRKGVSTSQTGQEFLREAQRMELSDREWGRMLRSLKQLRRSPR